MASSTGNDDTESTLEDLLFSREVNFGTASSVIVASSSSSSDQDDCSAPNQQQQQKQKQQKQKQQQQQSSVEEPSSSVTVSVQLRSKRASDDYATNLGYTGMALWFGATNLCDLISTEPDTILLRQAPLTMTTTTTTTTTRRAIKVLELGSGSGLVGLFAANMVAKYVAALNNGVTSAYGSSDNVGNKDSNTIVPSQEMPTKSDGETMLPAWDKVRGGTDPGGTRSHQPYEFVLTDCEPNVLENLRRNMALNGWEEESSSSPGGHKSPSTPGIEKEEATWQPINIVDAKDSSVSDDDLVHVTCDELRWGVEGAQRILDKYGTFDVIVGADLLYSDGYDEALFTTVKKLLKANDNHHHLHHQTSRFYLAYTRRKHDMDEACSVAQKVGLQFTVHPEHTIDIFGNYTDGQTIFWRDAIYIFSHATQSLLYKTDTDGRGKNNLEEKDEEKETISKSFDDLLFGR